MKSSSSEQGFTLVELVVTLGVALLFLSAGFMLFQLLMSRTGSAEWRTKASSLATSYISEQSTEISNPCVAKNLSVGEIPSGTLPGNPNIKAEISCPYGTSNPINRIRVTIGQGQGASGKIGQEVVRVHDFDAANR